MRRLRFVDWKLGRGFWTITISVFLFLQVYTRINVLEKKDVPISKDLPSRIPWKSDQECNMFKVSYLKPNSGSRIALASYPGSGSTWIRYLIEGSTGIFTGSVYKDIQLQLRGYWGEIRDFRDGTTIVQKTHDSSPQLIRDEFGKNGILILRNPYDAVMSKFNYLYGGHQGRASPDNFDRSVWEKFVEIEVNDWLDMALNWTSVASPHSLLVVHYENVQKDIRSEIRKITSFLGMTEDTERLNCLLKHKNGYFKRDQPKLLETKLPFNQNLRNKIDMIILEINRILISKGFERMPLDSYAMYNKTDENILHNLKEKNFKAIKAVNSELTRDTSDAETTIDGTKLILSQFIKYYGKDTKNHNVLLETIDKFKMPLNSTGVPEMLNLAVKILPNVERTFKRDPISAIVEDRKSSCSLDQLVNSLRQFEFP